MTSDSAPSPADGASRSSGSGGPSSAGRREFWTWLAGTVAGCLLVLLAASRPWIGGIGTGGTALGVALPTGGDLSPALTPLGLAGLAGVVAVLAAKGLGRRVIGGLLALCGIGAAASTWTATGRATVLEWLRGHGGPQGVGELTWDTVAIWPVVAGAGAVLIVAGGLLAVVRGGRWSGMSARYERGQGPKTDDKSLWEALDRGDDPTESP